MTTVGRIPAGFTLGVVGASGGIGASTLSAALATRASLAGHLSVIVDGDPLGGGLDVLLSCEREPGPRWAELSGARGQINAEVLRDRLPRSEQGVAVLSYGRAWAEPDGVAVEAVRAPLASVFDVAIFDLGRQIAPWTGELDAVVLLVGGSVTSMAGAQPTVDRLLRVGATPWLVTRGVDDALTPMLSEAVQAPVLESLPEDVRLSSDTDAGRVPGTRARSPLVRTCDRLLRELFIERRAA